MLHHRNCWGWCCSFNITEISNMMSQDIKQNYTCFLEGPIAVSFRSLNNDGVCRLKINRMQHTIELGCSFTFITPYFSPEFNLFSNRVNFGDLALNWPSDMNKFKSKLNYALLVVGPEILALIIYLIVGAKNEIAYRQQNLWDWDTFSTTGKMIY